jgi:hypothetical protein
MPNVFDLVYGKGMSRFMRKAMEAKEAEMLTRRPINTNTRLNSHSAGDRRDDGKKKTTKP